MIIAYKGGVDLVEEDAIDYVRVTTLREVQEVEIALNGSEWVLTDMTRAEGDLPDADHPIETTFKFTRRGGEKKLAELANHNSQFV
jgi:hypothetical protein